MHRDAVKQAHLLQAVAMKLRTVIQYEFPHDSMGGPVGPDFGISSFSQIFGRKASFRQSETVKKLGGMKPTNMPRTHRV